MPCACVVLVFCPGARQAILTQFEEPRFVTETGEDRCICILATRLCLAATRGLIVLVLDRL